MALEDLRIEEQDLSADSLSLEARDGESLEVIGIGVDGADADSIASVNIREETMLAFQADDGDDEAFPEELLHQRHTDILRRLRDQGLTAPSLKVPEGQDLSLATDTDTGNATVYYREGGPDDVSTDDPGAPGTKDRVFISNGQTTTEIGSNATEVVALEQSVNPNVLADFPFGEDAPSGFEFDLLGIMVALDDDADADHTLDTLRLSTEETDFLARASSFVDADNAEYPNANFTERPLTFPEPPTFVPGQDLDIEVEVTDTGGAAADTVVNAAVIFHRRVPGGA